jgi:plasmid stabilization system protein ParE
LIVVLTQQAESDFERIADYIAADSPNRALTFIRELRASCEALAEFPAANPLVPRYECYGVRRRVHGAYLIFYRIGVESVDVLHVLHGAVDYESLLFPPS